MIENEQEQEQPENAPTNAEGDESGDPAAIDKPGIAPAAEPESAAAAAATDVGAGSSDAPDAPTQDPNTSVANDTDGSMLPEKVTTLTDGVTLDARESKALAIASAPLHTLPSGTSATVQPDGSLSITVPDHPDVVNVPDASAERLPAGTEVVVLDGRLAANVPHGGSTHSVLAEVGEELHHLVARIEGFLRGLTTSSNNVEVKAPVAAGAGDAQNGRQAAQ